MGHLPMIPRRCPRARGEFLRPLAMVVVVVGRRRWWRVVIVVVAIVMGRLRCGLRGRLLYGLDDGGVAAGERQQGCAA